MGCAGAPGDKEGDHVRGQLSVDVVLSALGLIFAFMMLSSVMENALSETKESMARIVCFLSATDAKTSARLLSDLSAPEKVFISLGNFTIVEDINAGKAEVVWEEGRVSCG